MLLKSRKETPQKLTQLSSRSHPRHLVGKRTAQKDIPVDIKSDSQVNSNFLNRWSPASLTFNNYFYLFLYLYTTNLFLQWCKEQKIVPGEFLLQLFCVLDKSLPKINCFTLQRQSNTGKTYWTQTLMENTDIVGQTIPKLCCERNNTNI